MPTATLLFAVPSLAFAVYMLVDTVRWAESSAKIERLEEKVEEIQARHRGFVQWAIGFATVMVIFVVQQAWTYFFHVGK